MSQFLDQCFAKINQGEEVVAYKGNIDSELIARSLNTVEQKLEAYDIQNITRKKVYNVLVEILQNLYHHVDNPYNIDVTSDPHLSFGIFSLNKLDDGFRLSTGNYVHKDKVEAIKERIDKINALSSEELKNFYKFVLNNQKFSEKGGGGLGLIDMARKTGNKLQYEFVHYDDTYRFFCLTVFINY